MESKKLKSKIVEQQEIDWTKPLVISELRVDPQVLEMHKQRINTVFSQLPEQEREQQLHNIVLRDNLFSKAMDTLVQYYIMDLDPEDIKEYQNAIIASFGEEKRAYAEEIARKMIMKALIFKDLQEKYDIKITDQELIKILQDYYEQTNQPIRDFMQDKERFESAKQTLLEEKTTAFIIEKFPRDLSELEKKLYANVDELQKKEHEEEAKKN